MTAVAAVLEGLICCACGAPFLDLDACGVPRLCRLCGMEATDLADDIKRRRGDLGGQHSHKPKG